MSTVDPKNATNSQQVPAEEPPVKPGTAKPDTSKPDTGKSGTGKLGKEIGGAPGPEPTRYGDWQFKGRVTDF